MDDVIVQLSFTKTSSIQIYVAEAEQQQSGT